MKANRPLRVVFVSHGTELRGAERALVTLVDGLPRERCQPMVLVPGKGTLFQELNELGIPVRCTPYPYLACLQSRQNDPWYWSRLMAHLQKTAGSVARQIEHPDMIFSNGSWTLMGLMLASHLGLPHVWYFHDYGWFEEIFEGSPPVPLVIMTDIFTDLFLCPSQPCAERLSGAFPQRKIRVVGAGVEDVMNKPSCAEALPTSLVEWLAEQKPVFASVGSTSPEKGWDLIISAFSAAKKELPHAGLCLIGPETPNLYALRSLVESRGLGESVYFTGLLPMPAAVLRSCDAHIIASTSETLSFAMLEGMSVECPTITVRCGGPETLIQDGVTGLVADSRTEEALARAMIALGRDSKLRTRLGQAARIEAVSTYTIAGYRENCVAAMEEALQTFRRHGPMRRALASGVAGWARISCASPRMLVRAEAFSASCAAHILARLFK